MPGHGTRTSYVHYGCRCPACTKANRDYQNELQERLGKREPPSHGLNGYQNYGCRCGICSAAMAKKNAARYERRPA